MYIFFWIIVLTAGGDPNFQTYGQGPGKPHLFATKAECVLTQTFLMARYEAHPIGVMVEHGCAKLKSTVKWDA